MGMLMATGEAAGVDSSQCDDAESFFFVPGEGPPMPGIGSFKFPCSNDTLLCVFCTPGDEKAVCGLSSFGFGDSTAFTGDVSFAAVSGSDAFFFGVSAASSFALVASALTSSFVLSFEVRAAVGFESQVNESSSAADAFGDALGDSLGDDLTGRFSNVSSLSLRDAVVLAVLPPKGASLSAGDAVGLSALADGGARASGPAVAAGGFAEGLLFFFFEDAPPTLGLDEPPPIVRRCRRPVCLAARTRREPTPQWFTPHGSTPFAPKRHNECSLQPTKDTMFAISNKNAHNAALQRTIEISGDIRPPAQSCVSGLAFTNTVFPMYSALI
eukprot:Opistho-2@62054